MGCLTFFYCLLNAKGKAKLFKNVFLKTHRNAEKYKAYFIPVLFNLDI